MANSVTFTTVPNGLRLRQTADGTEFRLKVSLVTSPRLDFDPANPGTLADARYDDFRVWPDRLRNATFKLRVRAQWQAAPDEQDLFEDFISPVVAGDRGADIAFWTQFFPPETPVGSAVQEDEPVAERLVSYDAASLHEAIYLGYMFETTALVEGLRDGDRGAASNPIIRLLASDAAVEGDTLDASLRNERARYIRAFDQLAGFHRDVERSSEPFAVLGDDRDANSNLEFHEIEAALQEHIGLCRKLGLVHDFEALLPESLLTQIVENGETARTKIEVSRLPTTQTLNVFDPWTACDVIPRIGETSLGIFHPRNQDGSRSRDWGGFRTMSPDTGRLTNFEIDWLARGLIQTTQQLLDSDAPERDLEGKPQAPRRLGALRQGVVSLIDLPTSKDSIPDVLPVVNEVIEAVSKTRALRVTEGEVLADQASVDDSALFLDQGLVRGYRALIRNASGGELTSLCSRFREYSFTGGTLNGQQWVSGEEEGEVQTTTFAQEGSLNSQVSPYLWAWDGWSLVAPRIAAPVDDDGAVVERDEPSFNDVEINDEEVPKTLLRKRIGQTYEFLTLTSDLAGNSWTVDEAKEIFRDGSLEILTAKFSNDRLEPVRAPKIVDTDEREIGERGALLAVRSSNNTTTRRTAHIVPPDASLSTVEEHGVLDGMSDEKSFELIERTLGSFPNGETISDEFLSDDGRLLIPYLPDPMAQGVILRLVNSGESSALVPFPPQRASEPDTYRILLKSIRISLRGVPTDRPASVNVAGGDILIDVPEGETIHAELFSGVAENSVTDFWAANALRNSQGLLPSTLEVNAAALTGGLLSRTRTAVARGQEYVVCPSAALTLVNASQRPVFPPAYGGSFSVKRTLNSTLGELVDPEFKLHVPSTGRIEFSCGWEEIVDDGSSPDFVAVRNKIAPFGYNLEDGDLSVLGDPNHPRSYWDVGNQSETTPLREVRAEQTAARQTPTAHHFPDTKYRRVTYTARAITRYGSFFPPEVSSDPDAISKQMQRTVEVLNCSKPSEPNIRSILPVFKKQALDDGQTRRHVTGLRILIERPWLSSGEGEQLAIVLHPGELVPVNPVSSWKFTSWGFNPRKLGPATSIRPTLDQFKDYDDRVIGFDLQAASGDEQSAEACSLALYGVEVDQDRNVVFCDVEIDPERAYFPFIKLALARYQPKSIDGAHLSEIITANYVQLSPTRTVSYSNVQSGRVQITVTGYSYAESTSTLVTSSIEVVVERLIGSSEFEEEQIWQTIHTEPIRLTADWIGAGLVAWTGEVPFTSTTWRLTILEYEYEKAEEGTPDRPGEALREQVSPAEDGTKLTRRLVFSDSIVFD